MKIAVNIILVILTVCCLCVIAYVRLGIGFPVLQCDNYQNYNLVLENLSYSYIAGVIVYVLTIVLPDWWKARRLKPIIDNKIIYLSVLLNKQIWGFGIYADNEPYEADCMNLEECISLLNKADWNAINTTVKNTSNNKFYQTYSKDLDTIIDEINNILCTYKSQLSQEDIQHLENIRQADFITELKVHVEANSIFPPGGQKPIVEGHRKLLKEFYKILKNRKISLS